MATEAELMQAAREFQAANALYDSVCVEREKVKGQLGILDAELEELYKRGTEARQKLLNLAAAVSTPAVTRMGREFI